MQGFKEFFLDEVHYTDLYSKGFEAFRKKYNKVVRNKQDGSLYVQFTDHMTQNIDRTPWRNPDHSDPVAVYAYPLRYVINYPADVWYGQTAKYLRVLKNKARNPLRFFKMTEWEAERILMRMGLPTELLRLARKEGKYTGGSNQWAQAFMRAVQLRYDLEPEEGGWGMKHYAVRTGQEQSQLFLKAGYDALIDTARTQKQAAINDREPEQIAFLTRYAFEVVEVFPLRIQRTANHSLTSFEPERDVHGRKLVALVLEALGDRLVSGPVTWNWGSLYWSAKGKRVYINFDRKTDMSLGWGEKQHKALKLSDASKTILRIEHSERGKLGGEYYSDTKFKDIVDDVVSDWNQAKEVENFIPETKEMWEAETKRVQDEETKKRIQKEKEEKDAYNAELRVKLNKLKKHLGLDVPISDSVDYEHLFDFISKWVKTWMQDNKEYNEQGYESAMEALDAYFSDSDKMYKSFETEYEDEDPVELAVHFGYLPREILKDRPDLAAVIKILKEIWSRWPDNIDSNGTFAVSHALRQFEGNK